MVCLLLIFVSTAFLCHIFHGTCFFIMAVRIIIIIVLCVCAINSSSSCFALRGDKVRHYKTFQDKNASNPNQSPKAPSAKPSNHPLVSTLTPSFPRSIDHPSTLASTVLTNHPSNTTISAYPSPSYATSESIFH